MTNVPMDDELLEAAARKNRVPIDVLVALLTLEKEFGNATTPGSKGDFAIKVGEILDAGAARDSV